MDAEFKVCTKCKIEYPHTTEYFLPRKDKKSKSGLHSWCRECCREDNRLRRLARKDDPNYREQIRNRERSYYRRRRSDPVIVEQMREYDRKRRAIPEVLEKRREYKRRYRTKPEIQGRLKQSGRERARCLRAQPWYHEYKQQYLRRNPYMFKVAYHRRRTRKQGLPDTFAVADWEHAVDHFKGCCAVCGSQPDGELRLAMDHWIPLIAPDCPGTIATNIVPLCHGKNGCNNTKSTRNAKEWLIEKFGEPEAMRILARVEAYFASLEDAEKKACS